MAQHQVAQPWAAAPLANATAPCCPFKPGFRCQGKATQTVGPAQRSHGGPSLATHHFPPNRPPTRIGQARPLLWIAFEDSTRHFHASNPRFRGHKATAKATSQGCCKWAVVKAPHPPCCDKDPCQGEQGGDARDHGKGLAMFTNP